MSGRGAVAGSRRHVRVATAGALALLALTGCAHTVSGSAVSIYHDPYRVAGLPVSSGPTGPRPWAPDPGVTVVGTDDGDIDRLAAGAVADIETYWAGAYPELTGTPFEPVGEVVSWDPRRRGADFCGEATYHFVNAAYCPADDAIGWDRAFLLPDLAEAYGPMAVVTVLAHEYGHAIQAKAGTVADDDPGIVYEQQSDCFAGSFLRWVAEDHAPRFQLNTSDGLNSMLATMVSFRDSDPGDPESVHGSAFERVTAAQIGFTDGAAACARMDVDEIESRRASLPRDDGRTGPGELAVTAASVTALADSFATVVSLPASPTLTLDGADLGCVDARGTEPVSYCPATNTIGVDLAGLAERGAPPDDDEVPTADVRGDYNAYVLVASRYALALQHADGRRLDDAQAALRTACLSGAISAGLSPERAAQSATPPAITLSPGDLDEAVSGLLADGLAASDVNGVTVPSGFARVDAFRSGVLGGQPSCDHNYR